MIHDPEEELKMAPLKSMTFLSFVESVLLRAQTFLSFAAGHE